MKKKLLGIIMGAMMLVGALTPASAFAGCAETKLFGLDPWYAGLDCSNGELAQSNFTTNNLTGTIVKIIGNVVKDLMFVGGFVAVGFLIYAGIQYITSAGDPGKVAKASKSISAALTGLVICILG